METPRYHDHHIAPTAVDRPEARIPTDLDEYLFDLQGFVILRGALGAKEVDTANACVDRIPDSVPRNGWFGRVHREDHPEHRGKSYQQIYEAGEVFERMIDHPNYINYMARFVGGHGTFDRHQGPLFIDENFFNLRGPGDSIPLHSGGHRHTLRTIYDYHNGEFHCGQVNILFAFTDIGPGDGATMLIPGSHKSHIVHPAFCRPEAATAWRDDGGGAVDGIPGAVEVHLNKGDAVIFVDACAHGSAKRVNPGERRICVYRYGSAWNRTRWGYKPSDELLKRLNPYARSLVALSPELVP